MQPGNEAPRRSALAWQLAEEIAKLDPTHATHALDKVGRVSKLFGEISADPFSFISRMTADRRVDSLEASAAARLGEVAEALIEATKGELLANRLPQERAAE